MNSLPENVKKEPAKGVIKVSYTTLLICFVILAVIVVTIALLDYNVDSFSLEFKDYLSLCTFGSVATGLIYTAISLQYTYRYNLLRLVREDEQIEQNRVKITYDILSDWLKDDLSTKAEITKRFIQPYKGKLKDPATLKEFKDILASQPCFNEQKALTTVLNYFESLALLLDDKIIDEAILKKGFRTAILSYYETFREYIEDEQSEPGNARVFVNFVALAKKWQQI